MCSRIRSAFSVTWVSWRWRRLLSARSRKLSMVALPDLQIGGVVVARVAYCLRGTDGPVFVAGHGHLLDLGEGNLGLVLKRLGVLVLRQAPLVVRAGQSPECAPPGLPACSGNGSARRPPTPVPRRYWRS